MGKRGKGDRQRRRQGGSAMIYAMLFAAIVSIAILQVSRMSDIGHSQQQGEALKGVRDRLYRRINTLASLNEAVFQSAKVGAPANPRLTQCLYTPVVCGSAGALQPFTLYSPEGMPMAGTAAAPVLYDKRGNPCVNNCVFAAYSWFWTTGCPAGAICTSNPENIFTLVQITTVGTVATAAAPAPLPKNSELVPGPNFQADKLANKLSVAEVLYAKSLCPTGYAFVKAQNNNGECQPIATSQVCPAGQVFLSIDSEGHVQCAPYQWQGCYSGAASANMQCDAGGCSQTSGLGINCGYYGPKPLRMVQLYTPYTAPCYQIRAPNKKSNPNDNGTQICTLTYYFTCCG